MFTYYNKREWSVTENQIQTLLVYKNNEAIGYCHIDVEDKVIVCKKTKGKSHKRKKSFCKWQNCKNWLQSIS